MKSFDEWITLVENGEVKAPGLLAASLDFRTSLRLAFEAGHAAGYQAVYDAADDNFDDTYCECCSG